MMNYKKITRKSVGVQVTCRNFYSYCFISRYLPSLYRIIHKPNSVIFKINIINCIHTDFLIYKITVLNVDVCI